MVEIIGCKHMEIAAMVNVAVTDKGTLAEFRIGCKMCGKPFEFIPGHQISMDGTGMVIRIKPKGEDSGETEDGLCTDQRDVACDGESECDNAGGDNSLRPEAPVESSDGDREGTTVS